MIYKSTDSALGIVLFGGLHFYMISVSSLYAVVPLH